MSRNIYFNSFLIAILIGIAIFSFFGDIFLSFLICIFILLISINISVYYRQILYIIYSGFIGIILGLSLAFFDLEKKEGNVDIVDRYMGSYEFQSGEINSLHSRKEFYDEYIIKVGHIGHEKIDTNILSIVRIPKNFTLVPGQVISFEGKLYPLENFNGFEYEKYMLSKNIYYSSSANSFENLGKNNHHISDILFGSRQRLLTGIGDMYPKEEAIFLGGILLGARENIPSDLKDDFNNSGLTHFIAVSGFNITLCIIFIKFLFGFLPPLGRIFMVSVTIIFFSFFVGLGAPVVRAAIMGILGYIFIESGSKVRNMTLLLFTAVCMSLYSPLVLLYDVSFHLSFLAVIGIIYTQEFFKKILFFLPEFFAIKEAGVLTMAALVFTLPIMIFQFGQLSLLAPFANIAVTWTIPFAMLFGALSLLVGIISDVLGEFIGFIAFLFLSYDISMVRFFGNIESAVLKTDFGVYKNYFLALYFIFFTYIVRLYQFRIKNQP